MKSGVIPVSESSLSTIQINSITLDDLPDGQLLDTTQSSETVHATEGTMAVWRSTGRYAIPFVKIGSKVYYRAGDLKAFIARRTRHHTGERV